MAGYKPGSFFRLFLNGNKEGRIYSAILTKQAWSIKDLSYSENILLYQESRIT